MIDEITTLPEEWCIDAKTFKATYNPNKVYLGRSNNLERHTYVTLSFIFDDEAQQNEFFVWWEAYTDSGARPFYALLPIYADDDYYMLMQSAAFTHTVEPTYKITGTFMLFLNKTKDETYAPIAFDTLEYIDESSSGNIIMLRVDDADGDVISNFELVGYSDSDGSSAEVRGSSILYAPPPNFTGTKTIDFRASDGTHWSNTATATIDVTEVGAPVALDFDVTIVQGSSMSENENRKVSLTAFDGDGRALTYIIVSQGSSGELVDIVDDTSGDAYVRPNTNGSIYSFTFTFKVNNGVKDSNIAICTVQTEAALPIPMLDINMYEFLEPCSGTAPWNIPLPCTDPNGLKIAYTVTDLGGSGTASFYQFVMLESPPMAADELPTVEIESSAGSSGGGNYQVTADNGITTTTTPLIYNILSIEDNEIYDTVAVVRAELGRYASNIFIEIPFVGVNKPYDYFYKMEGCAKNGDHFYKSRAQGITMAIKTDPIVGVAVVVDNSFVEYIKQGDFEYESFVVEVTDCFSSATHSITVHVTQGI